MDFPTDQILHISCNANIMLEPPSRYLSQNFAQINSSTHLYVLFENKLKYVPPRIFQINYPPPKVLVEILFVLTNSSLIYRRLLRNFTTEHTQNGYKTSRQREKKY